MFAVKTEQQKKQEKILNRVNGNYFAELVVDNPSNPNPPKETPQQAIERIKKWCEEHGIKLRTEAN